MNVIVLYPDDIDWEKLKQEIQQQEAQDDDCGNRIKQIFLGSVLSITPSGKYYMPFACSNVTEAEAEKDEDWWDEMEKKAGEYGLYLTTSEGDPTDILIGEVIEEVPIGGEKCLTPKKSTHKRSRKR